VATEPPNRNPSPTPLPNRAKRAMAVAGSGVGPVRASAWVAGIAGARGTSGNVGAEDWRIRGWMAAFEYMAVGRGRTKKPLADTVYVYLLQVSKFMGRDVRRIPNQVFPKGWAHQSKARDPKKGEVTQAKAKTANISKFWRSICARAKIIVTKSSLTKPHRNSFISVVFAAPHKPETAKTGWSTLWGNAVGRFGFNVCSPKC